MKAEKSQKVEARKYTAISITQVENGYQVSCGDRTAEDRRRGMYEQNYQYVFNTAEALGKWVTENVVRP